MKEHRIRFFLAPFYYLILSLYKFEYVVAQTLAILTRSLQSRMDGGKGQQNAGKMKIAVGPWGGHGGTSWDDGCYSGVREIKLVYDRCIDSISVVYDKNGKPVKAEKHGGNGGCISVEIKLNFPEEYLISVSGHYSPVAHGMPPVVRSLTFKSNQRTFGPFGIEEGTPFYFPMEGGRIIGFKGRSGWYVDSIGFYVSRVQSKTITRRVQRWFQKSLEHKNIKETLTLKAAK